LHRYYRKLERRLQGRVEFFGNSPDPTPPQRLQLSTKTSGNARDAPSLRHPEPSLRDGTIAEAMGQRLLGLATCRRLSSGGLPTAPATPARNRRPSGASAPRTSIQSAPVRRRLSELRREGGDGSPQSTAPAAQRDEVSSFPGTSGCLILAHRRAHRAPSLCRGATQISLGWPVDGKSTAPFVRSGRGRRASSIRREHRQSKGMAALVTPCLIAALLAFSPSASARAADAKPEKIIVSSAVPVPWLPRPPRRPGGPSGSPE
jgi:hypothetical protein